MRRHGPGLPLLAILVGEAVANGPALSKAEPFALVSPVSSPSPLGVAAWRIDPLQAWGTVPTLDLFLLARQPITDVEEVVVRMRRDGGGPWAERRQPPRLGTVSTAGWSPDLLFDDHVLLPGPRDLCPGTYELQVGVAPYGQVETTSLQDLGVVRLPPSHGGACQPLEADAQSAAFVAVTDSSVDGVADGSIRPLRVGHDLTVDVDLRALKPTDGDDAITVQLLDNLGHVIAQRDSYANVDMVFTSIWRPEDPASIQLQLPVPADVPVGLYHLDLGLFSSSRARFDPILAQTASVPSAGLVQIAAFIVKPLGQSTSVTEASFGGFFGLQHATVNGGNKSVKPGATVPVDLVWRSLTPASMDYTLFVQTLSAEGRLVAQQDGPPLDGRYPTSAWSVGDVVSERRSVTLPDTIAPGTYSVIVGWYAQPSGERLPTVPEHSDRAVPVGTLTVSG